MIIHLSKNIQDNTPAMCGVECKTKAISTDYYMYKTYRIDQRCGRCQDALDAECERQRKWSI